MNRYTEETIRNWELSEKHAHVKVDYDALAFVARRDSSKEMPLPLWNDRGVHPETPRAFPSHVFWHNVVNFCFGHPHAKTETGDTLKFETQDAFGNPRRGAYAMGACFYRAFREKPILADDILTKAGTLPRAEKFFFGNPSIPLIPKRLELLEEAATVLKEWFEGNPMYLLEAGNFRAFGTDKDPGVVDILLRFFPKAFGDDRFIIAGKSRESAERIPLHFYKRAQLLMLEYHARAVSSGGELPTVEDVGEIGPIVDYQIPRFYESEGVLEYSDKLKRMIADRIPLESGSEMELEIRGATHWVLYWELLIMQALRREEGLPPIHMGHLDFLRWSQGRRIATPHHICLTTNY